MRDTICVEDMNEAIYLAFSVYWEWWATTRDEYLRKKGVVAQDQEW